MKFSIKSLLGGANLLAQTDAAVVRFENKAAQKLAGARFEVKNAADDIAELYIYGDIGWYDITANMVADALNQISVKNLVVRLNSSGGDVFDGIAIFNLLRNYAKKNGAKIEVHIDALAASIASVIAMAGDEIVIAKNAMMMIHRASGGCYGDAGDMAAMAQILESIENDMIVPTYASRTKQKVDDLIDMLKQSTWMNAAICIEKGFADRLEDDNGVAALLRPGLFNNVPAEIVTAAAKSEPEKPKASNDDFLAKVNARMRAIGASL
jgi:ATP-dependent protease ClpP protease subunit